MAGWAEGRRVAQTKFAIPRGPKLTIVRTRLLDVLDAGMLASLTLLSAPAGAGKSALLSSWIAEGRAPGPIAWLTLDADDADRRRFWRAVLATLARATGDEAVGELAVSPREPVSIDLVLPALVDALAGRDEPVVLVLDDFHEVIEAVQDDLERLARFSPPALRLVVVTRADPPIGLGRLRVDGSVTELRAADLAFTLDEVARLFGALGVALAPDLLATLWQRTEGWAAALRLAAVSLREHPDPAGFIERFAGTDVTISDYLVSEVLAGQPPELHAFLLRTSVVDTLSAELADALTGTTDGHAMLGRLERGGVLTTPLDEHGTWHRYHPLFAELLRAELRSQLPGEVNGLHERAATWLAAHGEDAAAMRHAVAACAWDLATQHITSRWVALMINGELGALRPAFDTMPSELVDGCPELALAFAGSFLVRGDRASAGPYLRRAEADAAAVPAERRAQFTAAIAAVHLYEGRMRGDLDAALKAARKLLDGDLLLEGDELSGTVRAFVLAQLGIVELWTGDLEAATDHLERAYATALETRSDWTSLAAVANLAVARVFRGEIARALRHAEDAVALAERRGWSRSEPAGAAYTVQAAVSIQRGRHDEADRLVARASQALRETRERPLRAAHALNRALLLGDRGEPEAALAILHAARDELGDWPLLPALDNLLVAHEGLLRAAVGERELARSLLERAERETATAVPVANALARLRLSEGDPAAARLALSPHLGARSPGLDEMPLSVRAEAWMLDALALDALADHENAARSLERSLDIAEPAGLLRLLIEHGSFVRPLLHRQVRRGTAHPAIIGEALEAIERRDGGARLTVLLGEPLSDREQAILRYLPTMMSNQEIAGELYVSVNTVKTHLKAIYRKLDAPGRREAVHRARELGMIP
jgi:LuxR family transcriptional regulator, maltose regulon positive regulatory protein